MKAFLRYAKARVEYEDRDAAYRIYVTDALRALLRNEGAPRFIEILEPSVQKPVPKAADVRAKIKNKLKGE